MRAIRLVTAACAGVILGACSVHGPPGQISDPGPRAGPETRVASPTVAPSPAGEASNDRSRDLTGFHLLDVSFSDRAHGLALGEFEDAVPPVLTVQRTADGGRTWETVAAPVQPPAGEVARVVSGSRARAWAFGPGLYATDDGGYTWTRQRPGGPVVDLGGDGEDVWAVIGGCADHGPARCRFELRLSADGGESWWPSRLPSPIRGPDVEIVREGSAGWIVSAGDSFHTRRLLVTHDGARTWAAVANPCRHPRHAWGTTMGPFGFEQHIAAVDSDRLWLVCVLEPVGGSTRAVVYRSSDGGMAWRLSSPEAFPFGYGFEIVATAPSVAWWVDRYVAQSLRRMRPAGQGEHPGIESTAPWVALQFADPLHGWAATADLVYRTADGGTTWRPVRLRPDACG